ncbi:Protein BTN1 [Schistosoma japonicum]|uniref:Battenin n=1 Tax=Schistosoma japonicum TaxID=6182 RepID=A0A4Z2D9C5_SCHJA|nr:Battenin [Schistosoma japonicum]TNN12998.1 Protein BTN1 [Schistosoma japonicum]
MSNECCRYRYRYSYRKLRNYVAFWCFGLGNNFSYVIMLSAAVDIIRKQQHINFSMNTTEYHSNCTKIGTGSVLLADILPSMIFKFISPIFIQKIHFHFKILCAVLLAVNSFLMVSFSQSFSMSLLGIVSASLSSGIGDVSFLSMLAFFEKSCVSAWSSGTGAAGLIGSLSYVGLTSITTPENTLRIIVLVPCATFLMYFFVLDRPHHEKFRFHFNPLIPSDNVSTESRNSLRTSRLTHDIEPDNILISLSTNVCVDGDLDEDVNHNDVIIYSDGYIQLRDEDDTDFCDNSQISNNLCSSVLHQQQPTLTVKLQLLKAMIGSLFSLTSVYFFEYLINQSLFELLYFPSISLTAPEQYRWYQVLYQLGVFLSRSSVNFIHLTTTWLMPLLQGINFVICLLQVIYGFIPYIWIMFFVIFYEGCLGGLTYVNTFYNIIQETSPIYREYAMALAAVSDSIGVAGAGILAIPLHNWLCNILT